MSCAIISKPCSRSSTPSCRTSGKRVTAIRATSRRELDDNFYIQQGIIVSASMTGAMLAGIEMLAPHAAHAVQHADAISQPVFDLASEAPIWENIVRYAQYFFSVMLGTGYVMLKPFASLLKNPVTAVLLIAATAGLAYFVTFTVKAMLGLDEPFEYVPSSAVTNKPFGV